MTSVDRRAADRRSATDVTISVGSYQRISQVLHDARQQAAAISALTQTVHRSKTFGQAETLYLVSRAAEQLIELLEHPLGGGTAAELLPLWRVIEDLVVAARTAGCVNLEVDVDEDARVLADPVLVRRATGNLLDNAIRSAGDGGRVSLCIQQDLESTYVIIEDSGPGFGQARKGRNSLGLGIVFEFLGSVHGTLEIRQSELGGALLRMVVPLVMDDHEAGLGALADLIV